MGGAFRFARGMLTPGFSPLAGRALDIAAAGRAFFYRNLEESAALTRTRGDNLQGALDILVLKSLEQGPMHGWGITLHIQRISNEVLRVEEGSLYPALHRMEEEKWIAAEWGLSDNNRRARFYRLTATGRRKPQQNERIGAASPVP